MSDHPMTCAAHGAVEWRGHLVCSRNAGGCGEVFQTQDPSAARFAERDCTKCKRRLMPVTKGEDPIVGKGFTARSLCPSCFTACVEAVAERAAAAAAAADPTIDLASDRLDTMPPPGEDT